MDLLLYYTEALLKLSQSTDPLMAAIYADAQTSLKEPRHLEQLVKSLDGIDWFSAERDGLGDLYEGLLEKNASETKSGAGQYFTPRPLIDTIIQVIKPQAGETVQDPAAGTGGFLIAADRAIKERTDNLYDLTERERQFQRNHAFIGMELVTSTRRLALMNLAVHGLHGDLGASYGDTFANDQHKTLRADYVLANPPFNISDWGGDKLTDDPRWVHGIPPKGNANFAWLQHMLARLSSRGRAGIVLANGSMSSSQNGEAQIRAAMVEADVVEVMVALPGQLFFNTQIPACLWFLTKKKAHARKGEVLFIDARKLATMISRVQGDLADEVIERIATTVAAWRGEALDADSKIDSCSRNGYVDIPGFCRSVALAEIAQHGHVLTPGRYVGAEAVEDDDEAFADKMQKLTEKLGEQMAKGAELDAVIRQKLEGLGYAF